MAKKKQQHFAEMKTFDCVFEPSNEQMLAGDYHLKGKWNSEYFGNENPITLELGCGKGEYSIELAKKYPHRNFIGVDVKGARLWRGSKTAETEQYSNVAFLRTKIEFINNFFAPDEIAEIWLTFSDPQPKDRKGTKRLTSEIFMSRYFRMLSKPRIVHIKTDSTVLYKRTMESLENVNHELLEHTTNLYGDDWLTFSEEQREILAIKTFYEQKWLAEKKNIHYIKIALTDEDK